MAYRPAIGLEVHAELKTRTKMFCDSANDPDETRPNVNVCPVCLAHPGTLPVINRDAVRHILRIGAAVGGTLATDYSEFDRKSYFYPDIPKGYQISQYEHPLVSGGELAGVALTRIHLEEDTARSIHAKGKSLIDFNRAGIPLMELVTEPVITDAETAGRFARELQLLLRTLGVGAANLEKGEMRIEANVSVSATDGVFGTKVEVKNLNSFRSVERAIAHEIERQTALIESGGKVVQETRGWDEAKQETFHQRLKEGSADYRYFPEPDLPKLVLAELPEFADAAIRASLPELPWQRRARYAESFGLKDDAIAYLAGSPERSAFFDAIASALDGDAKLCALAANYIASDLAGIYAKEGSEDYAALDAAAFSALIRLTAAGDLSSRGAKDTLAILVAEGGDPAAIAKAHGLLQIHDPAALVGAVDAALAAEPKAVAEYRSGKQAALQYLVGKAMRESRGAGNPERLRELLIEKLS
ncbi:MAG TPA: Asp-tRNA(Asn)/Glu-tRNA(Gln) amidotransferase subunit GatB [Candidatus Paceibacterota bacterium]|nr:Asp-tRNA(Asn)/Glu-tRNA(Gln) amidotransferase subunit GatB [Candidatus Paceibacterota bacterium]